MRHMQDDFFDGLNEQQLEAVNHIDGPLLVLAGAGTGKTKVLTSRIANIILNNHALPAQIMAVTFTNKAAREMRQRVENMVNNISGMQIGTFHAISARILRNHYSYAGLQNNFIIIDIDDQFRLIKKLLAENHYDEKKVPVKNIAHIISSWKDKAITSNQLGADLQTTSIHKAAAHIYPLYQERLLQLNAVDFGD